MLNDFLAILRDYYFGSVIELATIIFWLCAFLVSNILMRHTKSSVAKKVFAIIFAFCCFVSILVSSIGIARVVLYQSYHLGKSPPLNGAALVGKFNVRVYGADEFELSVIKSALDFLPQGVILPNSIRVFDNSHFMTALTFRDREEGHAHHFPDANNICLKKESVCLTNLWHEIDHIDAESLFTNAAVDWLLIASYGDNFVYDLSIDIDDGSFPKNGLWTGYGSTQYGEDMAEWRSMVYLCLYLGCNPQANPFMYVKDRDDLRYALKLGWMLEWKRITKDQYTKIKKLMVAMGFKFKP